MGKRNNKAKRSLSSLPNGLVQRKSSSTKKVGGGGGGSRMGFDPNSNPFEMTAKQKRPKHVVHNRPIAKPKTTKHALESLQRRQSQLRSTIHSSKKANQLIDRRIGQYDPTMTQEDQMLARLVKERTRQSQRVAKFRLDDDDNDGDGVNLLTHKGKKLDPTKSEAIYSDDEEDGGNLEAVDTELHFGGVGLSSTTDNPYGRTGPSGTDLSQLYGQTRKTELDDLIVRRKAMKAERMETRENQVDTFEKMDEQFGELSALLRYRKNEKRPMIPLKPSKEDQEMNEWNLEMREMMGRPKRQATDRTKTPEEIAKDEAERLHQLETRRLARMNGDFDEDDFSDISVDNNKGKSRRSKKLSNEKKKKKTSGQRERNPDEVSDSEDDNDEEGDGVQMMFTSDGLKYFDKDGNVVDKPLQPESKEKGGQHSDSDIDDSNDDDSDSHAEDDDDEDDSNNDNENAAIEPLTIGSRVRGNYRAEEQYGGQEAWYEGKIIKVQKNKKDGSITYDVEYDDGDLEEGMPPQNVRPVEKTSVEKVKESDKQRSETELSLKRKKAKDKARKEIPYVFEVPTTLDSLHELIAKYASTGADASTIIQRIYAANSVRSDHRNGEKMQNFYDVLLRRFMAVGDAIYTSGDGGPELGRSDQLDWIVKVMYKMAQEAPEKAGAVWGRRIGVLQNAHAKRLRDSEFVRDDEDEDDPWTAWPSTGVVLLLRAMGRIFPVTDRRHYVVTPTILLLAQMISQTPVLSRHDLAMGVMCSGLLIEYTVEAKRVVPEALSFLASTIRLFSPDTGHHHLTNPALDVASKEPFCTSLHQNVCDYHEEDNDVFPRLKLEKTFIGNNDNYDGEFAVALLASCLSLVEKYTLALKGSFTVPAETELLYEVSSSILSLRPKSYCLGLQKRVSKTASVIAGACPSKRVPLQRRGGTSATNLVAIKTLAPRMEDPARYSMSKDKGKKSVQAAIDRTRREYKREHKAIARELRMDGTFIESERRKDHAKKEDMARAKRQKNFAWLEGEQASMNQQVRLGGGLLKGGGTGLARAKAATAKMGIKKGGKLK